MTPGARRTALWLGLAIATLAVFAIGWWVGRDSGRAEDRVARLAPPPPAAPHDAPLPGGQIDALRRGVPVDREQTPPPLARVENTDRGRGRAYPMQPPTIPHAIDNYQVDKNANRCMLCHARANAAQFGAPPVSVTHYMDRDDQFLAAISPRRYFCNQCHVVQTDARPLVENGFLDIDTVLSTAPPVAGAD